MLRRKVIPAIGLCLLAQVAVAGEWNCKEEKTPTLSESTFKKIQDVYIQDPVETIIPHLQDLLSTVPDDEKALVSLTIANAELNAGKVEIAATEFRKIVDSETASTSVRERARATLALLLVEHGKARETIALYSSTDRPVCGELKGEETYALSLANNAVGNDMEARRLFSSPSLVLLSTIRSNPLQWNKWLVLQLRLDCVEKIWKECAADFEQVVRLPTRDDSITHQLNTFLPKLRTIPELSSVLGQLQKEQFISDQGVKPAAIRMAAPTRLELGSELIALSCPTTTYPDVARESDISGSVTVHIDIDERGIPGAVEVLESDPSGVFERATIEAAQRCKFKPYTVDGKPTIAGGTRTWQYSLSYDD